MSFWNDPLKRGIHFRRGYLFRISRPVAGAVSKKKWELLVDLRPDTSPSCTTFLLVGNQFLEPWKKQDFYRYHPMKMNECSPEKEPFRKENIIFQPSIFRFYLSFREGTSSSHKTWRSAKKHRDITPPLPNAPVARVSPLRLLPNENSCPAKSIHPNLNLHLPLASCTEATPKQ